MHRADAATDSLHAYLRAIAKLPRLTPEEERELGRRIQESAARGTVDEDALRRLVEANLRFVVAYAKRYRAFGVPFLDLIHEGTLGLIEAARRFDPSRNVTFITYAVWWIRQAILSALTDQTRAASLAPVSLDAPTGIAGDAAPELWEQIEQGTEPPAEAPIIRRALRARCRRRCAIWTPRSARSSRCDSGWGATRRIRARCRRSATACTSRASACGKSSREPRRSSGAPSASRVCAAFSTEAAHRDFKLQISQFRTNLQVNLTSEI